MKDTTLSAFEKLGARAYLVISIAMVSVHVSIANNRTITDARFAVGACSEVARRLDGLETQVIGYVLNASIAKMISPEHFADLAPIDDVRASAGYRRLAAASLLRRALTRLIVAS